MIPLYHENRLQIWIRSFFNEYVHKIHFLRVGEFWKSKAYTVGCLRVRVIKTPSEFWRNGFVAGFWDPAGKLRYYDFFLSLFSISNCKTIRRIFDPGSLSFKFPRQSVLTVRSLFSIEYDLYSQDGRNTHKHNETKILMQLAIGWKVFDQSMIYSRVSQSRVRLPLGLRHWVIKGTRTTGCTPFSNKAAYPHHMDLSINSFRCSQQILSRAQNNNQTDSKQ